MARATLLPYVSLDKEYCEEYKTYTFPTPTHLGLKYLEEMGFTEKECPHPRTLFRFLSHCMPAGRRQMMRGVNPWHVSPLNLTGFAKTM